MSATLLMMNHLTNKTVKAKTKEKKDVGTCLNCVYQGTGSIKCEMCKRAFKWQYYKAPKNLTDNFQIKT